MIELLCVQMSIKECNQRPYRIAVKVPVVQIIEQPVTLAKTPTLGVAQFLGAHIGMQLAFQIGRIISWTTLSIHVTTHTHLVLPEAAEKGGMQILSRKTFHQVLHIAVTGVVGI